MKETLSKVLIGGGGVAATEIANSASFLDPAEIYLFKSLSE
jgi:hypothetical protein